MCKKVNSHAHVHAIARPPTHTNCTPAPLGYLVLMLHVTFLCHQVFRGRSCLSWCGVGRVLSLLRLGLETITPELKATPPGRFVCIFVLAYMLLCVALRLLFLSVVLLATFALVDGVFPRNF